MHQQISEATRPTIDVDQLTPGEIATLFQRYNDAIGAMLASNNTLLVKLAELEATNLDQMKVLNDWANFNNFLQHALAIEVEKAGSASH